VRVHVGHNVVVTRWQLGRLLVYLKRERERERGKTYLDAKCKAFGSCCWRWGCMFLGVECKLEYRKRRRGEMAEMDIKR
jgi:hypothetical protein